MAYLSHGVNRNQTEILYGLRRFDTLVCGFLRFRLIQPGLFRQALFIANNTHISLTDYQVRIK